MKSPAGNGNLISRLPFLIFVLAVSSLAPAQEEAERSPIDRTTLVYGNDPSVKLLFKGRAGNLELKSSDTMGEGETVTDYQKGSGYVAYDRRKQTLTWRSKIKYTLNRLSKHIMRRAPYMRAEIPKGAELEFTLDITNVGLGTLDFADLDISRFRIDVNYGDVDVSFPTVNRSIVRGQAKFHLMAGDLEIYQLANLNASEIKINGGVGELTVDFGPKVLQDTVVKLDHDIGSMELIIPRGTNALISGTSRDLSKMGFTKNGNVWEPVIVHPDSPRLEIKMRGPLGDFNLEWK